MRATMRHPREPFEFVMFVYQVNKQPDFWVFDGTAYHRFALAGKRFHLVRSQEYLPAGATGFTAALTAPERRALLDAAAGRRVRLAFYSSIEACEREASLDRHQQYIFDRVPPAGALTVHGIEFLRDRNNTD